MKFRGSTFTVILFMSLGIFGIIHSLSFGYWESMIMPLIVSSSILILSVMEIASVRYRSIDSKDAVEIDNSSQAKILERNRLLYCVLWVVLYIVGIYLIGFFPSVSIITLILLRKQGRSWSSSITFSLILTVSLFLVFEIGLNTPLFNGIIWDTAAKIFYWVQNQLL